MVHSNALNEDIQDELGDPRLEKLWHKVPLAFTPSLPLNLNRLSTELRCGTVGSRSLLSPSLCPWDTICAVLVGQPGTSPLLLAVRTTGVRQALHSVWPNHIGVWSGWFVSGSGLWSRFSVLSEERGPVGVGSCCVGLSLVHLCFGYKPKQRAQVWAGAEAWQWFSSTGSLFRLLK